MFLTQTNYLLCNLVETSMLIKCMYFSPFLSEAFVESSGTKS